MRLVHLCRLDEAPAPGELREFTVEGRQLCVANDGGRLAAVDNICPHRQGPLAEGQLEAGRVLCPWHAWAFDLVDGVAEHNSAASVEVFPLEIEDTDVLVKLA
ncbi:Rieske (2Fe-2S) protein [Acidipila sp. EB88]|uniref:Rieske (2Fe-2S) protein n=1 Tax=Acidipila sp. EB88 TaxID=2305226 RepID=UPI000F5D8387|nr:Rieske (2Fe-2S) protein [Acidipila sp. EB88]RRA49664.1 Rieske (2Fe-2S) protein [Acidipila sp. EB88]